MKRKYIKYMIWVFAILFLLFLWKGCSALFYAEEEVYTSPEGTNTIVVKYDFVCRPDVFKKGWLWDKKIWSYPNGGFMETVHFSVEWISEYQIRLIYDDIKDDKYDEEYIITIPR